MSYLKLFFVFLFISTLPVSSLQAQILKKLKKKVQEATEEVVKEREEEESEMALDSMMREDQGKESDYQVQPNDILGASSENINVEDSYSFDTKVSYLMTIEENGKTSEINYEMWFPSEGNFMATKIVSSNDPENKDLPTSVVSIFDDDNQAMIMLMEEQKMAQMISMDKIKGIAEKENQAEKLETELQSIKPTGKTKNILGYLCEEFESEDETSKFSCWVTKELSLFQENMFFNMIQTLGGNTFESIPEDAQGLMMEMSFEDTSTKEKGRMKVTAIESVPNKINMSDYQVINFGL